MVVVAASKTPRPRLVTAPASCWRRATFPRASFPPLRRRSSLTGRSTQNGCRRLPRDARLLGPEHHLKPRARGSSQRASTGEDASGGGRRNSRRTENAQEAARRRRDTIRVTLPAEAILEATMEDPSKSPEPAPTAPCIAPDVERCLVHTGVPPRAPRSTRRCSRGCTTSARTTSSPKPSSSGWAGPRRHPPTSRPTWRRRKLFRAERDTLVFIASRMRAADFFMEGQRRGGATGMSVPRVALAAFLSTEIKAEVLGCRQKIR